MPYSNPTYESFRVIRSTLNLQSKDKMIEYLEKRIQELTEQKVRQEIIEIGRHALSDLQTAANCELDWFRALDDWVKASTQEPDVELRSVYAQLGAYLMCTAVNS